MKIQESSPRVLIWLNDALQARNMLQLYKAAGFEASLCSSALNLKKSAEAVGPVPLALVLSLAQVPQTTLRQLRQLQAQLPLASVLVISPYQDAGLRSAVLDAGADDCLMQPLDPTELIARTRARLRRAGLLLQAALKTIPTEQISFGPLKLEPGSRTAEIAGQRIKLTATEFRLLHLLARHANSRLSRDQIHQHLWQQAETAGSRRLDNFLLALRHKLPELAGFEIKTYYGGGYSLLLAL